MSEFVKFLPQVKDGVEPVVRWLFYLPLATVSVSIGLITHRRLQQTRSWLRIALDGLALLLLIILIPPYPYTSQRLLSNEFRARAILAAASWVAFLLTSTWPGRWSSTRGIFLLPALLSVVGVAGPIVQFLSLRHALDVVYGKPIAIGWGVWLMTAGMLTVLGDTLAAKRAQG